MKATFNLLKNGKNAISVFANETTKQIVEANRNSFGYNVILGLDKEFSDLARNTPGVKMNQGKSNYRQFSVSKNDMEKMGFKLVLRGENPLF
jgi:hypothetical protein